MLWAGQDPRENGPLLLLHSRAHRSEAFAFASMQGTHIPGVWLSATELVVSGTFASRLVRRLVFSNTFAASWRLVVGQLLVVGTFAPTWRV